MNARPTPIAWRRPLAPTTSLPNGTSRGIVGFCGVLCPSEAPSPPSSFCFFTLPPCDLMPLPRDRLNHPHSPRAPCLRFGGLALARPPPASSSLPPFYYILVFRRDDAKGTGHPGNLFHYYCMTQQIANKCRSAAVWPSSPPLEHGPITSHEKRGEKSALIAPKRLVDPQLPSTPPTSLPRSCPVSPVR